MNNREAIMVVTGVIAWLVVLAALLAAVAKSSSKRDDWVEDAEYTPLPVQTIPAPAQETPPEEPGEVPPVPNPWEVPLFDSEMRAVYEKCQEWHMAPELALALIGVESGYHRDAHNGKCWGLCQLHERYFPGAAQMTPEENIRAGLEYLGSLLDEADDLETALTCYRWGRDTGNREYAKKVLDRLEELGCLYD